MSGPERIVKRDGRVETFDRARIIEAIVKAQGAVNEPNPEIAGELTEVVLEHLVRNGDGDHPNVEMVQDAVIYVLQESGNYDAALAYSRYRDARESVRRRHRLTGDERVRPHLTVQNSRGDRTAWDTDRLEGHLRQRLGLSAKVAQDVRREVEGILAECAVNEISGFLLEHLVYAALVRCGLSRVAEAKAPFCVDRQAVMAELGRMDENGYDAAGRLGRSILRQWSLSERVPLEVQRLHSQGRMWVDGLDDPKRGSHFTATLDGEENPWQVIAHAFDLTARESRSWRRLTLILPPMVLGNLEAGPGPFVDVLESLARQAEIYLYCDGRTPLLEAWPFHSRHISLATYHQDFLILQALQALDLSLLSGPHLMQASYRRRVGVRLALNAQGLEDNFSRLDHLAMGLVSAARVRLDQLAHDPQLAAADIHFAIFGLSPGSSSNTYLERQVIQEGLRSGIALSRSSNLPEEACEHLAKLFE